MAKRARITVKEQRAIQRAKSQQVIIINRFLEKPNNSLKPHY